jgi:hypothetical protein
MISNADTAKKISELMLEFFQRLDESVEMVRGTSPPEETATYNKSIGRVVGPIVMNVLQPLYEKNPSLKPANWDR